MSITVSVFKPKGRKFFYAEWHDPQTGKVHRRSTGTSIKRDAERFAGRLAKDVETGEHSFQSRVLWSDFRRRYET